MKKILFPTDYSETAQNAFMYALRLADNIGAEIYVVHIYEPAIISGSITPEMVDKVQRKNTLDKLDKFKSQTPILRELASELNLEHVPVYYDLREGPIVPIILQIIEESKIDMLVMGTAGADSLNKRLFGSNTINTISKVNIPILSVPIKAKFHTIKSIAFTTLFSRKDEAALDKLLEITRKNGAVIKCLHIVDEKKPVAEQIINDWKLKYKDDAVQFFLLSSSDIEDGISNFIDSENIDILSSVARKRTFFEKLFSSSITSNLSSSIKIPIFIYKNEY